MPDPGYKGISVRFGLMFGRLEGFGRVYFPIHSCPSAPGGPDGIFEENSLKSGPPPEMADKKGRLHLLSLCLNLISLFSIQHIGNIIGEKGKSARSAKKGHFEYF
jgi:hypothetical protein